MPSFPDANHEGGVDEEAVHKRVAHPEPRSGIRAQSSWAFRLSHRADGMVFPMVSAVVDNLSI